MCKICVQAIYSGPSRIKNTDLRAAQEMMRISEFDSRVSFRPMPRLPFALSGCNFISNRLLKHLVFSKIPVSLKSGDVDCFYQYGESGLHPHTRGAPGIPSVKTDGFPMMRQALERSNVELQAIADHLARKNESYDCLHCHTDVSRENFLKYRPDWRERTVTIPFFMPHLEFVEEAFVFQKYKEIDFYKLIFVGGQGVRKGIEDLCQALDFLADEFHRLRVQVTIVSQDEPKLNRFKNVVYKPCLQRAEVLKLMRESHLFVLPTRRESFGLVFVEAMAQGCVCVGDNDFPRQEIFGEDAGIMVPPYNPQLLANTLRELIAEPSRVGEMALLALRRARERYAPDIVARQYAELFIRLRKTA